MEHKVMRTNIIRIGNSQGIRIPKIIIEQSHLGSEVDLEVEDEKIIIRPASHQRENWETKFKLMAEKGDDKMLDSDSTASSSWDKDEWEW
jgi:antitoxin MazE